MKNINEKLENELLNLGFEIQSTSFDNITQTDEMKFLRDVSISSCDELKLLRCFPDYFIIHKISSPDHGVFFIKILDSNNSLNKNTEYIYETYFPDRIVLIIYDDSEFKARWFHKDKSFQPIKNFFKKEIG